jgi:hypothetical protein
MRFMPAGYRYTAAVRTAQGGAPRTDALPTCRFRDVLNEPHERERLRLPPLAFVAVRLYLEDGTIVLTDHNRFPEVVQKSSVTNNPGRATVLSYGCQTL